MYRGTIVALRFRAALAARTGILQRRLMMKSPDYPTNQPKDPVDDALVDRNSDPDAIARAEPDKKHGDKLMEGAPPDHDKPVLEGSLEGERPRHDR
jgi:hypothetical protein